MSVSSYDFFLCVWEISWKYSVKSFLKLGVYKIVAKITWRNSENSEIIIHFHNFEL